MTATIMTYYYLLYFDGNKDSKRSELGILVTLNYYN
jgi:hypothetical protein